MKANDPVLHEQISHLTCSGRKAIAADSVIFITSFWDDDVKAQAVMVTFDHKGADTDQEELEDIIDSMAKGLNSMLSQTTKLTLVLKNTETGEMIDVADSSSQSYLLEVER